MNTLLLSLTLISGVLSAPTVHDRMASQPAIRVAPIAVMVAQTPTPTQTPPPINIEVTHVNRVWYANPVWIAIGGLALVVVILMIVMAARGSGPGGTTIVRG